MIWTKEKWNGVQAPRKQETGFKKPDISVRCLWWHEGGGGHLSCCSDVAPPPPMGLAMVQVVTWEGLYYLSMYLQSKIWICNSSALEAKKKRPCLLWVPLWQKHPSLHKFSYIHNLVDFFALPKSVRQVWSSCKEEREEEKENCCVTEENPCVVIWKFLN